MDTETELEVNEKTRHEDKVVHLQMIQGVIDRMSKMCIRDSHKIRVVQTTDTTDGQVGVLPHLIAEFEEASRLAEIGMIGGRDGVFQCRMVCQRYMEAGHTRLLQQRNEHR